MSFLRINIDLTIDLVLSDDVDSDIIFENLGNDELALRIARTTNPELQIDVVLESLEGLLNAGVTLTSPGIVSIDENDTFILNMEDGTQLIFNTDQAPDPEPEPVLQTLPAVDMSQARPGATLGEFTWRPTGHTDAIRNAMDEIGIRARGVPARRHAGGGRVAAEQGITDQLVSVAERLSEAPGSELPRAIAFLSKAYGTRFDSENRLTPIKEKVVFKEPDPVNDNEEVIINYTELSDVLAKEALTAKYGIDYSEDMYIDEYIELATRYEILILKNKRKVNA